MSTNHLPSELEVPEDPPKPSDVILDQLDSLKIQETARAAPPEFYVYEENGMFVCSIPSPHGAGTQKFRAQTPKELVKVLARAQYHATEHIRRLTTALRDRYDEVSHPLTENPLAITTGL